MQLTAVLDEMCQIIPRGTWPLLQHTFLCHNKAAASTDFRDQQRLVPTFDRIKEG